MSRAVVKLAAGDGQTLVVVVEEIRAWLIDPPHAEVAPVQRKSPVRTMLYIRDQGHPVIVHGDHGEALERAVTGAS